jgi:hypothetical protein
MLKPEAPQLAANFLNVFSLERGDKRFGKLLGQFLRDAFTTRYKWGHDLPNVLTIGSCRIEC